MMNEIQPNKERIKLWVDRLRDPKTLHTREGLLRIETTGCLCALGVGIQVAMDGGCPVYWDTHIVRENDESGYSETGFTKSVFEWYGLSQTYADPADTGNGDVVVIIEMEDDDGYPRRYETSIIELNDGSRPKSLAAIADCIAETYL